MKKALIIQNKIMHYRIPLFNSLAGLYDLTIIHSGKPIQPFSDFFREKIVPCKKIGPFYFQEGVIHEINDVRYDVVIAMFDIRWLANVIAPYIHKSKRFLYWGHRYSNNYFANWIRNILMKKADGLILYSKGEISRMLEAGISKNRIFVAPNTIEVKNHSNTTSGKKDSFLFVGRSQKRKRIDKLIESFSEILPKLPQKVSIDIVGEGPENAKIKALVSKLNIEDRVIFHGAITDNKQLKPLFSKAFAYVSPGPVGLGVLHSLAYGVPVITKSKQKHGPEFENLSDEKNAIIYSDDEELSQALLRICHDSVLQQRLGKNAYGLYSNERTMQDMVNGFIRAIENTPNIPDNL